jgi:hypothetical protein
MTDSFSLLRKSWEVIRSLHGNMVVLSLDILLCIGIEKEGT